MERFEFISVAFLSSLCRHQEHIHACPHLSSLPAISTFAAPSVALLFGLFSAPQVFLKVLALLCSQDIYGLRDLDDLLLSKRLTQILE